MSWLDIMSIALGSGSLFSVITWFATWQSSRKKREAEEATSHSTAITQMQDDLKKIVIRNSELYDEILELRKSNSELKEQLTDITTYLEEIKEIYQKETGKQPPKRRKKVTENDKRISEQQPT